MKNIKLGAIALLTLMVSFQAFAGWGGEPRKSAKVRGENGWVAPFFKFVNNQGINATWSLYSDSGALITSKSQSNGATDFYTIGSENITKVMVTWSSGGKIAPAQNKTGSWNRNTMMIRAGTYKGYRFKIEGSSIRYEKLSP